MKSLSIDIETYSEANLSKCGVYRYAEDPSFEILLFGVSIDENPVTTYDLASGEQIPDDILQALSNKNIAKYAYNASFERVCLSVYLHRHYPQYFKSYEKPDDAVNNYLRPEGWYCDMVLGAYNGLPLGLAVIGSVLGFEKQKLTEGKDLVRYFCTPCKPTEKNGYRTRNRASDDPAKWQQFKAYNVRDVEVQLQIHNRLKNYPVPDKVWNEYWLDQEFNDRGILVDRPLVKGAIRIDGLTKEDLTSRLKQITGMENPNSVAQLKSWLCANGIQVDTLGKKEVQAMLDQVPDNVREVLELRLQLAKSSVKKYEAMQTCMCADGRCRGLFQFYGSHTGRWAGRLIQLQNLPQNHMKDLDEARTLVRDGDFDTLELLYDNVPQVLSELIRTAFIPKEGYKFVVSDFSAIEARVLSFLAGEQWRIDVFKNNGDIYCASASAMFHVPVEKHGVNSQLRQKGKISELALGYGGSTGALKAMGALQMGLTEEELPSLVSKWRNSNPHIVNYWWQIDTAIKKVIEYHSDESVGCLQIYWRSGVLFIKLPSGRTLSYIQPRIGTNRFGGESITYMGLDQQKHWTRLESYGPKFTENIVQAISRDILAEAMQRLRRYYIVGHVHDELIIEVPKDTDYKAICKEMSETPTWISGLPLRADGYECPYYQKD